MEIEIRVFDILLVSAAHTSGIRNSRKVRYGSLLAVTLNWESPRAVKVRSEVVDKVWSIFGSTFHSGVRYRAFSTGEVLVSNW